MRDTQAVTAELDMIEAQGGHPGAGVTVLDATGMYLPDGETRYTD